MTIATDAVQPLNLSIPADKSQKTDISISPIRESARVKARLAKRTIKKNRGIKAKYLTKKKNVGDKKALKRLQVTRPAIDKIFIINILQKGKTKAQISREYGIPESTIRGWVKEEAKIRVQAAEEAENMQNSLAVSPASSAVSISTPRPTLSPQAVPPLWVQANCVAPISTTSDVPITTQEQLNQWMNDKITEFRRAAVTMQICQMMHSMPIT